MYRLKITFISVSCLVLAACSPLAVVSTVGSTITNASYNQAERDLKNPKKSHDQQALEVAIANMQLGLEYMKQGNYEKALYNLKRSTLAKADYAPSYSILGLLYQKLGDPVAAEANFKKSLKLDASDSSTYNNYGLFLCSNQRYEEANTAFLHAANNPLYDTPETALTNAGLCALESDPVTAENYFNQALNKNSEFPYALIQMARLSYDRSEYETAYEYFKRYKQKARQTPKSLWLGIRIAKELDYKDDFASYALLLKNKFPDTQEAKMLMEMHL